MASKMLLLLIVVFIFDAIVVGLAIAAELMRSTSTVLVDSAETYQYCSYSSNISTGFGIGASFFLLWSQISVMAAGRRFFCGQPSKPGGSRALEVTVLVMCWVFFVIAEVCLIGGSVRNAYQTKRRSMWAAGEDRLPCKTLRRGVFAAGAAFVSLNLMVSAIYYYCFSKAIRDSSQLDNVEAVVEKDNEKREDG